MADFSYRYRFAPCAVRDLQRLPGPVAAACVEFITTDLRTQPHLLGKPLRGSLAGLWSARRGPYRIIYRLDDTPRRGDTGRLLEVIHIEHRQHTNR